MDQLEVRLLVESDVESLSNIGQRYLGCQCYQVAVIEKNSAEDDQLGFHNDVRRIVCLRADKSRIGLGDAQGHQCADDSNSSDVFHIFYLHDSVAGSKDQPDNTLVNGCFWLR